MSVTKNKTQKWGQSRFTNYLYLWLSLIGIFTIIIIAVGHYNFPHCLFVSYTVVNPSNTKFLNIRDFTPAYPPPLVAFE